MAKSKTALLASELLQHFNRTLRVSFDAPPDLLATAESAVIGCRPTTMYPEDVREAHLVALVNGKLKLNKDRLQAVLDIAATERVFPNYHDKVEILSCLDYRDKPRFARWAKRSGCLQDLVRYFDPVRLEESLAALHELLRTGAVKRSDARRCGLSERQTEILRSLYGSYVFHTFPTEAMHRHFNADCRTTYHSDFYQHLLAFYPGSFHRDCALVYLQVTERLARQFPGVALRDALYGFIARTYRRLANHCILAIQIEPFLEGGEDGQWRLFSDIVLFAEKHREIPLKTGYFRSDEIRTATQSHIAGLDPAAARFDLANEGFFFRDCIVLAKQKDRGCDDILLVFDKNERDETLIPCPGCRSTDVAGNSYPALGVRSWECRNPICPDRSAFDRGNRYSLASIIKQEAIKSEDEQIPEWSLRRWKLDLVSGVDSEAVADMLVRHFSFHGDRVVFVNGLAGNSELLGRRVLAEPFDPADAQPGAYKRFQESTFFKRFVVEKPRPPNPVEHVRLGRDEAVVYNGNCFDVLGALPPSNVDGAVTSPPYYNARSYAVWPNIYCYLYDMYNDARAVCRSLRPGAYYIFNIFDYFDNENTIVFSAMGKKRMILGAYIINLFRRVGFELQGNVAWYKGEIEGKRNYNQGNRSPYYQVPLNCWEHCFVFRKPGRKARRLTFPRVLVAKPVYKIVRGQNVLGHTAPFPADIPLLLISQMRSGEIVLDPYSGSMTTGRTARKHGLDSLSIEIHREYCELGLRLFDNEDQWREAAGDRAEFVQLTFPGF
jgi:DNA modification methylase